MTGKEETEANLFDLKQEWQIRSFKEEKQGLGKETYIFKYTHTSRSSQWIFHKVKSAGCIIYSYLSHYFLPPKLKLGIGGYSLSLIFYGKKKNPFLSSSAYFI